MATRLMIDQYRVSAHSGFGYAFLPSFQRLFDDHPDAAG